MTDEKMASIEIEIEDSLLFQIMKQAHEADVTLNKYIEVILSDYLEEMETKSLDDQK